VGGGVGAIDAVTLAWVGVLRSVVGVRAGTDTGVIPGTAEAVGGWAKHATSDKPSKTNRAIMANWRLTIF
jgi:hypothetical protein